MNEYDIYSALRCNILLLAKFNPVIFVSKTEPPSPIHYSLVHMVRYTNHYSLEMFVDVFEDVGGRTQQSR